MNLSMHHILLSLIAVLFISGCTKQPLQEISDTKSAVDTIMSEGAEKYLPDETKNINDALNKAIDEVKAQDAKIFRNYEKAGRMLAAVRAEAEAMNAQLSVKKEESKKEAIALMEEVKTLIDATKALTEKTSSGKKPKVVDEPVASEMKNLETSFRELQVLLDREDYLTAISHVAEIKQKASAVSTLIKQSPTHAVKKKR